jgi:hypothetical protein
LSNFGTTGYGTGFTTRFELAESLLGTISDTGEPLKLLFEMISDLSKRIALVAPVGGHFRVRSNKVKHHASAASI